MPDPHAVNSLIESPEADPLEGKVRWSPMLSLWNSGMAGGALLLGPLTFSPGALAVFLLTTGATPADPSQLRMPALARTHPRLFRHDRRDERTARHHPHA